MSPLVSNIRALVDKVVSILRRSRAKSEIIRTAALRVADNISVNNANVENNADNNLAIGVSSDEGGEDQWYLIPEVIKAFNAAFNVPVIDTHIWFWFFSFAAKVVIMELDGIDIKINPETGQYSLYGKAASIIVTGKADMTYGVCSTGLFNLACLGCAVPQGGDSCLTGSSDPGTINMETGDGRHFLNRTVRIRQQDTRKLR